METKQDKEFGTVLYVQGNCELEQRVVLGGQEVPIRVDGEEDEGNLSPMQRQAVRHALALGPDALEVAAPVVVQNYEVYREALDEEQTPQLERLVDVWKQVRIKCISVPAHHDVQNAYFEFQAECDWDPEHGLEVRFRNGVALDANQSGETGGAWDDSPEYLEQARQAIEEAASTALKKPGEQA